jgi:hypothetical protein
MIITVHSGPPGCGKTQELISRSILSKGRYLFACPRIDLIEERERDLRRMMAVSGTSPTLVVIHGQKGRRAPVHQQIVEAIEGHQSDDHVIVLITHEGMMMSDFDDCAGWHVLIDEIPPAFVGGNLTVRAGATYFERCFDLMSDSDSCWSKLLVRDDAPSTKALLQDDLLQGLATLEKRARSPQGVYVNVHDWADLQVHGRKLQWWSAWTPLQLRSFESVTIAGAGFHESILAKTMQVLHSGEFEINDVRLPGLNRASRRVRIHYFTRGHRGSTTFWEGPGRKCLNAVTRVLKDQDVGYYSGNKVVTDYLDGWLNAEMVSPKAEGTNSLMHHRSCAFIYSAKAKPDDEPLISLFDISREEIERAREIEDVIQFVLRGDLRNPTSTLDYSIYLYDLHQAEALATYIQEQSLGDPELVGLDHAGIMDVKRPARGRPRTIEDMRTKKERAAEKREKDAARKRRD